MFCATACCGKANNGGKDSEDVIVGRRNVPGLPLLFEAEPCGGEEGELKTSLAIPAALAAQTKVQATSLGGAQACAGQRPEEASEVRTDASVGVSSGLRSPDAGGRGELPSIEPPRGSEDANATTAPDETQDNVRHLMGLLEIGQPLGHLSDFAKEYGDADFCRRLLLKYKGDLQKCGDKLKAALTWREQHKPLLTTRNFAHASDYRVIGADLEGRPVLYYCMKNQLLPLSQCLDQQVVCLLQAVDNMPVGVETATHIWDCHGMILHLNLNPVPLVKIFGIFEGYFAERMHSVIVVDMPWAGAFIRDAVWPVVPQRTKDKIAFMSADAAKREFRAHATQRCARALLRPWMRTGMQRYRWTRDDGIGCELTSGASLSQLSHRDLRSCHVTCSGP
mmetsp:Transcript_75431/g.245370  ORF Transcript_75431/g.245370 Transcript_75431/m.245370 type:complete len:393 (-) Transcript_75431:77-1255(-)